jgi:hypothetical protein
MRHAAKLIDCCGLMAALLPLSGCIAAKTALFDPTKAVTSIPPGQYQEQALVYGGRTHQVGRLKMSGNQYTWRAGDPFRLFDIGDGLMVVEVERKNPNGSTEYAYDLLELADSAYLHYRLQCVDVLNSSVTPDRNPIVTEESYVGITCTFGDQNRLVTGIRAAAKRLRPTERYVPVE